MAVITLTTTAIQDAAGQKAATEFNAMQKLGNPSWVDLTALQWFTTVFIQTYLDSLVAHYNEQTGQTKAQLYQQATDTDKAAIDAILAKYV